MPAWALVSCIQPTGEVTQVAMPQCLYDALGATVRLCVLCQGPAAHLWCLGEQVAAHHRGLAPHRHGPPVDTTDRVYFFGGCGTCVAERRFATSALQALDAILREPGGAESHGLLALVQFR